MNKRKIEKDREEKRWNNLVASICMVCDEQNSDAIKTDVMENVIMYSGDSESDCSWIVDVIVKYPDISNDAKLIENDYSRIIESMVKYPNIYNIDVMKTCVAKLKEMTKNVYTRHSSILIGFAKSGNLKAAEFSIRTGADINAVDKKGWTASMWAAENGHWDIVKFLIESGADIHAGNDYVSWRALIGNNPEMVKFLEEYEKKSNLEKEEKEKEVEKVSISKSKNSKSKVYVEAHPSKIASHDNKVTAYLEDASGMLSFVICTNGWGNSTSEICMVLKEAIIRKEMITIFGEYNGEWMDVSFFSVIINGKNVYFM